MANILITLEIDPKLHSNKINHKVVNSDKGKDTCEVFVHGIEYNWDLIQYIRKITVKIFDKKEDEWNKNISISASNVFTLKGNYFVIYNQISNIVLTGEKTKTLLIGATDLDIEDPKNLDKSISILKIHENGNVELLESLLSDFQEGQLKLISKKNK